MGDVGKRLLALSIYIVATLPFVEWPGSVLERGIEPLAKALCFYLFIVATVNTPRKMKILLAVYVGAQVFRVLEPLYLHVTTGYWGSFTSLGNWEYMDRLAGSPYDIINPNGLGFLVVTTLPLLHYLCAPSTAVKKVIWTVLAGLLCYALVLSASRSAFLALLVLGLVVIYKSKHRIPMFIVAGVLSVVALGLMTDLQRERYLSIVSHDAKGGATAEGRINGVIADLEVALRRPLFGHGLGTSREANANFRGEDMLSHDLYTEVAEELGFVGLAIFLSVIWAIIRDCYRSRKLVESVRSKHAELEFLTRLSGSLLVLVVVYLFFSIASYGLSEPYWYIIGGVAAVAARLTAAIADRGVEPEVSRSVPSIS